MFAIVCQSFCTDASVCFFHWWVLKWFEVEVVCLWCSTCTAWCSEIGSLTSLDPCTSGAFSEVSEPIPLLQAVKTLSCAAICICFCISLFLVTVIWPIHGMVCTSCTVPHTRHVQVHSPINWSLLSRSEHVRLAQVSLKLHDCNQ